MNYKMSRSDWREIGVKMGWLKIAQDKSELLEIFSPFLQLIEDAPLELQDKVEYPEGLNDKNNRVAAIKALNKFKEALSNGPEEEAKSAFFKAYKSLKYYVENSEENDEDPMPVRAGEMLTDFEKIFEELTKNEPKDVDDPLDYYYPGTGESMGDNRYLSYLNRN